MSLSRRILLLAFLVLTVSIVGLLSRYWFLDVPAYVRICGSSSPEWWCTLRQWIINPYTYILSLVCGLIAIRQSSLNWSYASIAIGVLGLFSFNPYWSIANPDWSIAGLLTGLFALMRS